MINAVKILLSLTLLLIVAACSETSVEEHNIKYGVAINGYDPVAYHSLAVTAGDDSYSYNYKGAKYLFANQANLDLFSNDPEKFVPKYGGYCAFGVSLGKKFEVDPNSYAVVDNVLYMLLNQATLKTWDSEREKNIAVADRLWPGLKDIPAAELNKEN